MRAILGFLGLALLAGLFVYAAWFAYDLMATVSTFLSLIAGGGAL